MPAAAAGMHPVQLSIVHQEHYSRGLGCLGVLGFFIKGLLLFPIFIWLFLSGIVVGLVAWIMQVVVVFTGSYPSGPHRLVTGWVRLSTRCSAWYLGLTDRYPGTSIMS